MKRLMMICFLALAGCQSEDDCYSEMNARLDRLKQALVLDTAMSDETRNGGLIDILEAKSDLIIIRASDDLDVCDYEAIGGRLRLKN